MSDPVFFPPLRRISLAEISELTKARLADEARGPDEISSVAGLETAVSGQITFLDAKKGAALAGKVRASAVFCTEAAVDRLPAGVAALVTPHPQRAFAALSRALYPEATFPTPVMASKGLSSPTVSPHAIVAPDARIEPGAIIEAGAVIGPMATIGAGAVIAPNAVIGPSCQIGRNSYIGPGASVQAALIGDRVIIHAGVRIGTDGFGFVPGARGLEKLPQIGRVIIQDNVEIGANSTIDRGAMQDTVIGEGTKIDNLVQIGHNVAIGRCCAIAALTGIGGSTRIGDFVMIGGRTGIADHITIGDGAQLAGGSGVMEDIAPGARMGGTPTQPIKSWLREVSMLRDMTKAKVRRQVLK
ncbi:MAG: UDP-3-O-(3-hydroxymyristoyl)glucosamine N-acyltransferase [Mesorhizobium sp.]